MKLGKRRYEDVVILQFVGELGSHNLPRLKTRLEPLLEGGDTKLVLETGRLSYVNSAALGYLIRTAKEAKAQGGGVVLATPSQFLKDTLITLQITHLFPVFESIQQGILHFREGAEVSELDLVGAVAADPPPLEVPVHFRGVGDENEDTSKQLGRIVNVREDSLLFRYGPIEGKSYEGLSLAEGKLLHLRFRQPFVVKDYIFELEGKVRQVNRLEEDGVDHGVSVRVSYDDIKLQDKVHLSQFARDQALWREERNAE